MGVRRGARAAAMTTIAMFVSGSSNVRGAFVASPLCRPLVPASLLSADRLPARDGRSPSLMGAWRSPFSAAGHAGVPVRRGGASTASFATMQSSNKFELEGRLKQVFDVQTFPSGFSKREFIVTTNEMYPQDVKFELIKDKTSLVDQFSVDSPIKVSFNIRGNMWNEKYYVNLVAWRLEMGGEGDDFAGVMAAGSGWDTSPAGGDQPAGKAPAPEVKASFNDLQGGWDNVGSSEPVTAAPPPEPKSKSWDDDVAF
mmetsp:Transcript_8947/g.20863  ORF Transcript_8947/g.20863 Transcript_8947/m.20863 type:complete len:255 (-) Transcript_8947:227-991(-)